MPSPHFSIVIPVYNEERVIPELCRRLSQVMDELCNKDEQAIDVPPIDQKLRVDKKENENAQKVEPQQFQANSYEIIMVDDGSTDLSWQIIKDLHEQDPRVNGARFSRNFGHHIAITAGIDHARGNYVIVMDGDLQDPPEEIPKLYKKLTEGYDLVYGTRKKRKDNIFRKTTSHIFSKIINKLSSVPIAENDAMLRIMTRQYVENFKKLSEKNRFLAGLFSWTGFNQTSIPIEHAPRFAGKSKYNLFKMLKLTFHAITSFSNIPLQISGFTGLALSFTAFIYAAWLIIKKLFFDISVTGWASLMVVLLLISGFQLIMLWLVGQYIGRVFTEVQGRPLYILKEKTDAFGE